MAENKQNQNKIKAEEGKLKRQEEMEAKMQKNNDKLLQFEEEKEQKQ